MANVSMSPVLRERCEAGARTLWRLTKVPGEPTRWEDLPRATHEYWFGVASGLYWLFMDGAYAPQTGVQLRKD